jgi:hypothetical protein
LPVPDEETASGPLKEPAWKKPIGNNNGEMQNLLFTIIVAYGFFLPAVWRSFLRQDHSKNMLL